VKTKGTDKFHNDSTAALKPREPEAKILTLTVGHEEE
jgi:hypothetical protein